MGDDGRPTTDHPHPSTPNPDSSGPSTIRAMAEVDSEKGTPFVTGSCLCGAVRYEVDSPATQVDNCHCPMCRKQHGAAFATYAGYPKGHVRVVAGEDQVQT